VRLHCFTDLHMGRASAMRLAEPAAAEGADAMVSAMEATR
jgi:hypothetical protein